jgi:hypothetical protein
MRRLVAALAIASGLGLIVATFATSAFLRTGEGERLLDRFRVVTSPKGFTAFDEAYAETRTAVNELVTKTYPRFARDFGMTGAQFDAYVKSNLSAVAYGVEAVQALPSLFDPVTNGVAALPDGKFEPTYDLPVSFLPLTSVPWLLLGLGLALVAAGIAAWRVPARLTPALVLAAGLGMIVVPFAISLPSKASQTGRVVKVVTVALSPQSATRSEQASYATDGMVRQFNVELLPAVAKRRGIPVSALTAQLRTESPAFSKFLRDWKSIGPASFAVAADIRESVAEFAEAKQFPFEAIPWLVIALGGMLLAASAAALASRSR